MITRIILPLLGIFFLTILGTSCKKDENENQPDSFFHCVQVNDINNGSPVEDAFVILTAVFSNGNQQDYPGTTEANGKSCIEIHSGGTITGYVVSKAYYTTVSGSGAPETVQLTPEAKLTLYVFNGPPSAAGDVMTLSYEHPLLGDSIIKTFNGNNVDTTLSLYVTPGLNTVKWTSVHNSISTDSSYGPVNMYGNNTVYTIVY